MLADSLAVCVSSDSREAVQVVRSAKETRTFVKHATRCLQTSWWHVDTCSGPTHLVGEDHIVIVYAIRLSAGSDFGVGHGCCCHHLYFSLVGTPRVGLELLS